MSLVVSILTDILAIPMSDDVHVCALYNRPVRLFASRDQECEDVAKAIALVLRGRTVRRATSVYRKEQQTRSGDTIEDFAFIGNKIYEVAGSGELVKPESNRFADVVHKARFRDT